MYGFLDRVSHRPAATGFTAASRACRAHNRAATTINEVALDYLSDPIIYKSSIAM